eukprot:gene6672-7425_t
MSYISLLSAAEKQPLLQEKDDDDEEEEQEQEQETKKEFSTPPNSKKNLDQAFREASTASTTDQTTPPQPPTSTDDDDNHCSCSDNEQQWILQDRHNARLKRLDIDQKQNLLQMQTEHEHDLQSIGCILLNKHAVHSDRLKCQQQLYQIQDKFTKLFKVAPSEQETTNSLLYRFYETRAAFADLQHPLRELNDAVDTQNGEMNKIRNKVNAYTAQMIATLTTYLNLWNSTHHKNATTYNEVLSAQLAHNKKILKKMDEFRDLLHEAPTQTSTLVAFLPNTSVEQLERDGNDIMTTCLSYEAELSSSRHAYYQLFRQLTQCQQKTGIVKEKKKNNKNEPITRYSSRAPTLHKFQPMTNLTTPKAYTLESQV